MDLVWYAQDGTCRNFACNTNIDFKIINLSKSKNSDFCVIILLCSENFRIFTNTSFG